tara:strand:+ start:720 stop:971 length:252 start_codon:yes stop_codon:yes gene_type:complete
LDGLTSINDRQAEILSNISGETVGLSGLTSITDKQAESLSKGDYLLLNGLTSITDEQAESLSKIMNLQIPPSCQKLVDKYKDP